MEVAALVMGIIGLALGIIVTIACLACIGAGAAALANDPTFMDAINSL